ncbi:phosphotransferase family protein [Arenimonas caeni]|uniref:Phosphotransferase family protein n=1 Tax=Arenimonas caeni TaxID=2058085 RepID=A0A2P6MCW7_9GAMM|nr:phosphotransferase family protein [Arenimonas caeni]PRH83848.1 phosphotransferase family protein [Arenimonas caeni]
MILPETELAAYLEANLMGFRGPLVATKFKGGQSNPTYLVEAASGKYVLRRKPPGKLLPSAHAVDREFRVLQALHGGPVPVARPLHLCSDESVIGSMFYLMEFVDGRVHWDPSLPDLSPAQRAAHYEAIIATLAALHALDPAAIGLADYGKPGNYFARQVHRWTEQYRASETEAIPAMEALIERLPARCPADDGRVSLVHGDFRIDNLMFAHDQARVLAVVDWELSTLGHPLADLGYFCMALRLPRNPALPGLAGLDRAALGIPSEDALLARYSELSGQPAPADWSFVLAFSFFRLAAIAQGVAKRARQGNASSEQAAQAGQMTALLAGLGASALEG